MKIVGVGCGPGMLTENAIMAISQADLIYGSKRAIELVSHHTKNNCEIHEISDYKNLKTLPDNAVILSTGDPMLAGLGYLRGEIIPGVSSMQVSFAILGISLIRSVVVTAHGKNHTAAINATIEEVKREKVVFLIADPDFSVKILAASLSPVYPDCKISVCENLGYPDERISSGTAINPPIPRGKLFAIVVGNY
ncbi:MAG: cobalt-precorrin-7 (C(5))-methyltransferase [Euryarchaeota archaeon]|nr:cobalt-precorrin-7 (C(5))-methyltransferase [Euryarchaeota archaeon]